MKEILSVETMRRSDAAAIAAGTPGRELMRRAAEGIFQSLPAWQGPAALICGTGNNAGDGYALALLLREAGVDCTLFLREKRFTGDGRFFFDQCAEAGIPVRLWAELSTLKGWATVADCIFGTGFRGEPDAEAARMIRMINESGAFVVSADINTEAEDLRELFPPRPHFSHKGDWGYLALFGGSLRYSGAIRLAHLAAGAMRAGAGVARICAPRSLCPLLVPQILESTLFPLSDREGDFLFREEEFASAIRGVKAIAFGMGIGHTPETEKAVTWLLGHAEVPLILDADGLNALAALDRSLLLRARGPVILTPHPGEFSRLTGLRTADIQNAPAATAEAFAQAHHVIVLLKGTATVVTDGERTRLISRGCPGMATAGSGDVLSGILAALCAAHPDRPLEDAAGAAWLAGRAGEIAQEKFGDVSMLSGDTAAALPEAIREIRSAGTAEAVSE